MKRLATLVSSYRDKIFTMKLAALFLVCASIFALQQSVEPAHEPVPVRSAPATAGELTRRIAAVQNKNFYLLSLLESDSSAREAIENDKALAAMTSARWAVIAQAQHCNGDLSCTTNAFRWNEDEISSAAKAVAALYGTSQAIRDVTDHVRASGIYVCYTLDEDGPCHRGLSGAEFLRAAWTDSIRRVNHAIEIYGQGRPAQPYPDIDSITQKANCDGRAEPVEWLKCDEWRFAVQNLTTVLYDDRAELGLPFAASLRFALELLAMNRRDEAGRFEPLEVGENAAAIRRLKANSIDWDKYAYTVIVVPGRGPDLPDIPLSPLGRVRDDIGARRYREGKAPFLLVSGGYVHPNQTPFCEAIKMKEDLIMRLGIPEDAIIVDPHARHTTTNMRNAARLIYRYGIPFNRQALVTTDPVQSATIGSGSFADRCKKELGFIPFRNVVRISASDLEFRPALESLQLDPNDLLDP